MCLFHHYPICSFAALLLTLSLLSGGNIANGSDAAVGPDLGLPLPKPLNCSMLRKSKVSAIRDLTEEEEIWKGMKLATICQSCTSSLSSP